MKSTAHTRGPEEVFGTHPLMGGLGPESDTGCDLFQAPRHFQILIGEDILILV